MSTILQHEVSCNATSKFVTFFATLSDNKLQLKKLGKWVKKHREAMNYSQETAAEKVGLSRYQWIRIENGQSGTKRETIINIAKELNADVAEGLTLLAGLEPENGQAPNTFNVSLEENVRLSLFHGAKYTEAEQEEFVEAFNVAYEIAKRRIQERRKTSQE